MDNYLAVILFFGALILLWLLNSIRDLLKQIVIDMRATNSEITAISINIQALRDRHAPMRTDYPA
jgi:hypothetical protein